MMKPGLYQSTFMSPNARSGAEGLANNKTVEPFVLLTDPYASAAPAFYIGIFNTSTKDLRIPRPWVPGGYVILKGRTEEGLYGKPFILPDVFKLPKQTEEGINIINQDGAFLAQDIVNSSEPYGNWRTTHPYSQSEEEAVGNIGTNYYFRGIFWCKLSTPQSEPDFNALETTIERLEGYYSNLIREANVYYTSGPKQQEWITAVHHEAADYFEKTGNPLDLQWHLKLTGGLAGRLAEARKAKAKLVEPTPAPTNATA